MISTEDMENTRRSEPYRILIKRTKFDPSVVRMVEFEVGTGEEARSYKVRADQTLEVPGLGKITVDNSADGGSEPMLLVDGQPLAEPIAPTAWYPVPLVENRLNAVPPTPRELARRSNRVQDLFNDRRGNVVYTYGAPRGWFPLLEAAFQAVAAAMACDPEATFVVRDIKEKFGTLRCYAGAWTADDVLGRFCDDAVDWAEAASHGRCAAFGTPDGINASLYGWFLTLSPRARRIGEKSRKVLSNLMYPPVHDIDSDSPISISEAAELLEIDEDEVWNLIHTGALGADPDCEELFKSDADYFLSTLVLE